MKTFRKNFTRCYAIIVSLIAIASFSVMIQCRVSSEISLSPSALSLVSDPHFDNMVFMNVVNLDPRLITLEIINYTEHLFLFGYNSFWLEYFTENSWRVVRPLQQGGHSFLSAAMQLDVNRFEHWFGLSNYEPLTSGVLYRVRLRPFIHIDYPASHNAILHHDIVAEFYWE